MIPKRLSLPGKSSSGRINIQLLLSLKILDDLWAAILKWE